MSAAVFHARGLTKICRMGDVDVPALRGVDLDLFEGELVVLLAFIRELTHASSTGEEMHRSARA